MLIESLYEFIGNTPLYHCKRYQKDHHLKANLFAKIEWGEPSGSIKDRIALEMIHGYEKEGKINQDTILIEPTSGNTGIALSCLCAYEKRKLILVMPNNMSIERKKLLSMYPSKLVLTEAKLGMEGALLKAQELHQYYENSLILNQFSTPYNVFAHYKATGKEIYEDLKGKIDIFISPFGTSGTLIGVGKYLKEKNPLIKVIGVEPKKSPFISLGKKGSHQIQGIGAGFKPKIFDSRYVDEILLVDDLDAFNNVKEFICSEGLFIGISSGAALEAYKMLSQRIENEDKNIVVIFPDNGLKYLSMFES